MRRSLRLLGELTVASVQPQLGHNTRPVCISSVLRSTGKPGGGSKASQSGSSGGGTGDKQAGVGSRFSQTNKSSSGTRAGARTSTTRNAMSSLEVKHDKGSHRFVLDLGNNQSARIDYKQLGGAKIEMYHTEVPAELRGKGIGRTLAKGALDAAAKANMKVKLTCTYLVHYIDNYADARQKKLVEK